MKYFIKRFIFIFLGVCQHESKNHVSAAPTRQSRQGPHPHEGYKPTAGTSPSISKINKNK